MGRRIRLLRVGGEVGCLRRGVGAAGSFGGGSVRFVRIFFIF